MMTKNSDAWRRENADACFSGVGGRVGCVELPHGRRVALIPLEVYIINVINL